MAMTTLTDIGEKIKFADILEDLLIAEDTVYKRTDVTECDEDFDVAGLTENLKINRRALQLLRESKRLKTIHQYFRKFESHRCCIQLVGGQNTAAYVRLDMAFVVYDAIFRPAVRIVYQRAIDPFLRACLSFFSFAATKIEPTRCPVIELSYEESRAYCKAILCAWFPVLTAPSFPHDHPHSRRSSATSRTVSSSSSSSSVIGLVMGGEPADKVLTRLSDGVGGTQSSLSDEDMSVISADVLRLAVVNAFSLTEQAATAYLKEAYKPYQRKADGLILAEDLVYQLSMLEKNTHPYYNKANFVSADGYASWVNSNRSRLLTLLNKFWQQPMPFICDKTKFDAQTIHHDYVVLQAKLLSYEDHLFHSRNTPIERNHSNRLSPLSNVSLKCLLEFSLRFGIGEVFRKLALLERLAEQMCLEVLSFRRLTECLRDIILLNRPCIILVQSEVKALRRCADTILVEARQMLTRFHVRYQPIASCQTVTGDEDEDVHKRTVLSTLLELISVDVEFINFLYSAATSAAAGGETVNGLVDASVVIRSCCEEHFRLVYEDHVTVLSTRLKASTDGDVSDALRSARIINCLVSCIRDDVNNCKLIYQAPLSKYVSDVVSLSAGILYDLLIGRVCQLFANVKTSPSDVEFGLVGLIYRLNTLDQDWHQFILLKRQVWRTAVSELVSFWFSAIQQNAHRLLLDSLSKDRFSPIYISSGEFSSSSILPVRNSPLKLRANQRSPVSASTTAIDVQSLFTQSMNSAFNTVEVAKNKRNDVAADTCSLQTEPTRVLYSHKIENSSTISVDAPISSVSQLSSRSSSLSSRSSINGHQLTVQVDVIVSDYDLRNDDSNLVDGDHGKLNDLPTVMETNADLKTLHNKEICTAIIGYDSANIISDATVSAGNFAEINEALINNEDRIKKQSNDSSELDHISANDKVINEKDNLATGTSGNNRPADGKPAAESAARNLVIIDDKIIDITCDNLTESSNMNTSRCDVAMEKPSKNVPVTTINEASLDPSIVKPDASDAGFASSNLDEINCKREDLLTKSGTESSVGDSKLSPAREQNCVTNQVPAEIQNDSGMTGNYCENVLNGGENSRTSIVDLSSIRSLSNSADVGDNNSSAYQVQLNEACTGVSVVHFSTHDTADSYCVTPVALANNGIEKESVKSVDSQGGDPGTGNAKHLCHGMTDIDVFGRDQHIPRGKRIKDDDVDVENSEHGIASHSIGSAQKPHLSTPSTTDAIAARQSKQLRTNFIEHNNIDQEEQQPEDNVPHIVVPVSGDKTVSAPPETVVVQCTMSLVDVVCLLHRLVHVTRVIASTVGANSCKTQHCVDVTGNDDETTLALSRRMASLRSDLMKMLCDLIRVYAKNLLAMDMCALIQSTAIELAGREIVEELKADKVEGGVIWGCRHKLIGSDCLEYLKRHATYIADQFEPVGREMCLRIVDISHLRQITCVLCARLNHLWSTTARSSDCRDGIEENEELGEDFKRLLLYVDSSIATLINIMAHRLHLFVNATLHRLLDEDHVSRSRQLEGVRMLTRFLSANLMLIHSYLNRPEYNAFIERLWKSIVADIESLVLNLHRYLPRVDQLSVNLINVITALMGVVRSAHVEAEIDRLIRLMDDVSYWLHMYSLPTQRLVYICNLLMIRTTNHDSAVASMCEEEAAYIGGQRWSKERLRSIYNHLHRTRKSFRGQQLLDWIKQHPVEDMGADFLTQDGADVSDVVASHREYRARVEIESLLDVGLLVLIDPASALGSSYLSSSDPSIELFPRLIRYSQSGEILEDNSQVSRHVAVSDSDSFVDRSSAAGQVQLPAVDENGAGSGIYVSDDAGGSETAFEESRSRRTDSCPVDVADWMTFNASSWYRLTCFDEEQPSSRQRPESSALFITSQQRRNSQSSLSSSMCQMSSVDVERCFENGEPTLRYQTPPVGRGLNTTPANSGTTPVYMRSEDGACTLRNCSVNHYVARRVTIGLVLGVLAARKERDFEARRFLMMLQEIIVQQHAPWLKDLRGVRFKQSILGCLHFWQTSN